VVGHGDTETTGTSEVVEDQEASTEDLDCSPGAPNEGREQPSLCTNDPRISRHGDTWPSDERSHLSMARTGDPTGRGATLGSVVATGCIDHSEAALGSTLGVAPMAGSEPSSCMWDISCNSP
jgi:hypothetical protein